MRIAVVYNRNSKSVINLFGMPNRETIGLKTIERLVRALKQGGHTVISLEGDKDLLDRLEEFMPRVVHGERPGLVFNVSYGIQGQARYTHVPSILEMAGIPYVASGPLGHSLSLDKVVTKMILRQRGLPTPDFVVLERPDSPVEGLRYPAIVKPKNEAVSFGLKVVNNEDELREGAEVIFKEYRQAVLAEQYIEGREINVGLLGNNPPEAFPPVMLDFGEGPQIYTYEDKTARSARRIEPVCPAPLGEELTRKAQEIAVDAFQALGLYDCARVDMRLDDRDNFYILEANSLPSLGEHGSYLVGAAEVGLDFTKFVNRLVEVASTRYFGMPDPPVLDRKAADPRTHVLSYVSQRRDEMEKKVRSWVELTSRTVDVLGCRMAVERAEKVFRGLGLKPVNDLTDEPEVWTWETKAGLEGGTLFVCHLDTPYDSSVPIQAFRRDPESLYGDGVGQSRAPLVMLEYALRSLRSIRRLNQIPLGVLLYTDEGRDARDSERFIREAAKRVKRVMVLRPGAVPETMILRRRGNRRLRLRLSGESTDPSTKAASPLTVMMGVLAEFSKLSAPRKKLSVSVLELHTEAHALRLPHQISATVLVTYLDSRDADEVETRMRTVLKKTGRRSSLVVDADRPAMRDRPINQRLFRELKTLAGEMEMPLEKDTSTWSTVAGLVPAKVACVCGVGPFVRGRGTPSEAVSRLSLVQRTLLLAEFLARQLPEKAAGKKVTALKAPSRKTTKKAPRKRVTRKAS